LLVLREAETWHSGLICHGGDAGKTAAASGEAFHPNSDEKEAFVQRTVMMVREANKVPRSKLRVCMSYNPVA